MNKKENEEITKSANNELSQNIPDNILNSLNTKEQKKYLNQLNNINNKELNYKVYTKLNWEE